MKVFTSTIRRLFFVVLAFSWLVLALLLSLPFGLRYIFTGCVDWEWYENSMIMSALRWLEYQLDKID